MGVLTLAPLLFAHNSMCPDLRTPATMVLRMGGGFLPHINHFSDGCLWCMTIALLVDPEQRFDTSNRVHVWLKRYLIALSMYNLFSMVKPFPFISCNPSIRSLPRFFSVARSLLYVVLQIILACVSLLRLDFVASSKSLVRVAYRGFWFTVACG